MKRYFIGFLLALMALVLIPVSAHAASQWDLVGNYTIDFVCTSGCGGTWTHTMDVSGMDMSTGDFNGTGYYRTGSPTWTAAGNVNDPNLTFTVDYDSSSYYVDVEGNIAIDGSMSGTASNLSQSFTWSTTSGVATFNRDGEIVEPEVDEIVFNELNLEAYLVDNDEDFVDWAVRRETCTAGTNTVLGNVDGHHDALAMAYDPGTYTYTYMGSFDITGFDAGMYCFIFNPREDSGESDIRLTREFSIVPDADGDGLPADIDCDDADPDVAVTSDSKACILYQGGGVTGKGILSAPGLQKPFNPNSKAAENAGKK